MRLITIPRLLASRSFHLMRAGQTWCKSTEYIVEMVAMAILPGVRLDVLLDMEETK